jgi:hypothetical protein
LDRGTSGEEVGQKEKLRQEAQGRAAREGEKPAIAASDFEFDHDDVVVCIVITSCVMRPVDRTN